MGNLKKQDSFSRQLLIDAFYLFILCVNIVGGNEKQIGEAGFRLGKAYEEYGDSDAAIKVRLKF